MKHVYSLILICCCNNSFSQTYIEAFTGYQKDINNRKYNFNMINSGLQISWKKSRTYELFVQIQRGWALKNSSPETFYTASPSLPLTSNGIKTISPSTATFSLGHRFTVTGKNFNGSINILLQAGLAYQKIKVSYNNDKQNYTVLNPDNTQRKSGYFIATGIEYSKQLTKGRIFFQTLIGPQPWFGRLPKNISFNMMAPLSLNAGYSYMIKSKKRNGK